MQKIEGLRSGRTTTTKSSAGARARGKSERVSEVRGCEVGVARSVLVATDVECNFPFAAHQRL